MRLPSLLSEIRFHLSLLSAITISAEFDPNANHPDYPDCRAARVSAYPQPDGRMNEPTPQRTRIRTLGAALLGILAIVLPSIATDILMRAIGLYPPLGQPVPDSFLIIATAYRTVYAIAGTYLAARLAPERPMRLALLLGAVGVVINLFGLMAAWNHQTEFGARWYPVTLTLLAMPTAWLGGRLGERR
jgi:uncharacterized membrane protein HdeD (DUF308 family)